MDSCVFDQLNDYLTSSTWTLLTPFKCHTFEKCLTRSLRFLCPCPPCRLQQPLQVPTGLSEEDRSVTHLQSDVRGVWVQHTGAALWRSSFAAKAARLYAAADGQDREVQGGPVGQGGWTGWARWVGWLGKVGGLVGHCGWAGWARWVGWFLVSLLFSEWAFTTFRQLCG